MPSEKGLSETFVAMRDKIDLSEGCENNICTQMVSFLQEEGISSYLSENEKTLSVMATYQNSSFTGGPSFQINKNPENSLWIADVWRSNANGNKMKFLIYPVDPNNIYITILEHSFRGKDRGVTVEEWFENVINSIKKAQERDCFNWLYNTQYIDPR